MKTLKYWLASPITEPGANPLPPVRAESKKMILDHFKAAGYHLAYARGNSVWKTAENQAVYKHPVKVQLAFDNAMSLVSTLLTPGFQETSYIDAATEAEASPAEAGQDAEAAQEAPSADAPAGQ